MVNKLRLAEIVMGDTAVNESQRKYLKDSLKVVATQDIEQGEIISLIRLLINDPVILMGICLWILKIIYRL